MVRRFAFLCLLALATDALANGRPPRTSTISFRPGAENEIAAGMSFGLLISKDGGATWRWMCEDALPYGGMYDPDYEIMPSGTMFATTFDGLKVNRDGCVFDSTVLAPPEPDLKFFSVVARTGTTFFAAAADPKDGKIYKSTDDGMTFPQSVQPGMLNDWWQSLEIAASDANRMYLSGYRFVQSGGGGTTKEFLLMTSTNAGMTWNPLPITDFTLKSNSTLEIAGISKTDPLRVYARVKLEDNAIADGLYRSVNGGANWTKILSKQGEIAFLVRANGDLVAGTLTQGMQKSINNGDTWTDVTGAPHVNCLVENAAGQVWACTQNYGSPQIPMDGFGIMKSTDLTTWTGVLKYQEIYEPVSCPMTTLQYMRCDKPDGAPGQPLGWCGLCAQLGCDPKRVCPTDVDGAVDGPIKNGNEKGCCDTGNGSAPTGLALGIAVGIVLLRRRRRT